MMTTVKKGKITREKFGKCMERKQMKVKWKHYRGPENVQFHKYGCERTGGQVEGSKMATTVGIRCV